MKPSYIILVLIILAFSTNPKKSEHVNKWNELWSQSLDAIEEKGGLSGGLMGIANMLGAKKLGEDVIEVKYSNYLLFSIGEADLDIPFNDGQKLGRSIGFFGNLFLIK